MKFNKIIRMMLTVLIGVSSIAVGRGGGGHGGGGHGGGFHGGGGRGFSRGGFARGGSFGGAHGYSGYRGATGYRGSSHSNVSHMGYSSNARTTGSYSKMSPGRSSATGRGAGRAGNRQAGRNRGYNRGYNRGGWNSGWGWGYGGWFWGATAALIAGIWLFGGWTYDEWEDLAAQDPERQEYFETVVQPAYQQYQQDPTSVPVRDSKTSTGKAVQPMRTGRTISTESVSTPMRVRAN